ncbi:LysM peptidoglycan-binding domain-containing protein [Ramlibacter sp. XY19]|uniref:LysM peptidoglycan-binding domain-containing protein n=1 Tax=Ramlibacter paludis TaxID=2908000 RepID=UPI0023DBC5E0|nr:LysM peptidoglycan-binding domain-containing protein [Ramlibacter paludis]MCG2593198.1 LysM peptidoglycan-binding domain-containing protein [Ramlibacter paludis]
MVQIVSGNGPGLNLSSREVLGGLSLPGYVAGGNAAAGRSGQGVYLNASNGQLIVQATDDRLVAPGQDMAALRTYNSAGLVVDDNGDHWSTDVLALRLTGTINTVGSTIARVDRDGSTAIYDLVAPNVYRSTAGAGAYDTLTYVAADNQFEWCDGSTGATQRFEASGNYRILSSRDPSGNTLAYAYRTGNLLASITAGNGDATIYDYAGSNLTQILTQSGGVLTTRVRYSYDGTNRLTGVTVDLTPSDNSVADGNVYRTTYAYDDTKSRCVNRITQSDGTSLAFNYELVNGSYRVTSVQDGLGRTTWFGYGAGYTTVTDAQNLVTRYDFDPSGQLKSVTAPSFVASCQFEYNGKGDVVSATDGEGRKTIFTYDANGNQLEQRDAAGNTVSRLFDAGNQLVAETVYVQASAPATSRQVYGDDKKNRLLFTVSAEGRVTEYRYDGLGQQKTSLVYCAGLYPVAGLGASATLTESNLKTWVATQNPATVQRVDTAYDGRGQVQSRTSYAKVDAAGAGVLDGSQSVERFVYDRAGLLLQTTSARDGTTSYVYDGLGRVLSTVDALGQATVNQYSDGAGKTAVTLANGLVTTSCYDAAGRLFSVLRSTLTGASLGETRYFYDASDRLRMTKDPTGVCNWFFYDTAGRKTAEVDGNGTLTEYLYDRRGLQTRVFTWGLAVDVARLTSAGLPDLSVTPEMLRPLVGGGDTATWRQFDDAGRLVLEASSSGTAPVAAVTQYVYDGASRLLQTIRYANTILADSSPGSVVPGWVPLPVASAYDRVLRNFYDADGRLAGTLDAEGYLTTFQYTPAGQLFERRAYATLTRADQRANGTLAQLLPAPSTDDQRSVTFYDGKGQAVAAVDAEGYLSETVYDGNGNATTSVRYANKVTATVTPASSVLALRPTASALDRSTSRTYDKLDRLISETSPEGVRTDYGYAATGNLVSTVRAANSTDWRSLLLQVDLLGRVTAELSAEGATLLTGGQTQAQVDAIWAQYAIRHTYDAAGRRTLTTDALGHRSVFFYNADGALTHSVNALGEVQQTRYDARGRILERITCANRINPQGLAGGVLAEGSAAAGTLASASSAALDSRTTFTYTRDNLVASTTDAAGTVTYASYDVFGDLLGTWTSGAGVGVTQSHGYDRRGLHTMTIDDAGGLNVTRWNVYDAFGRLVRFDDGRGNVTQQSFDRLGRKVSVRDPLGGTRATSYDAFDRTLTETDAVGNVTRYAYDAAKRTMEVTTPEGLRTTTAYTRHGQVLSLTDGKGQVTSYSYDRNGKLLSTAAAQASTSSVYDAASRLVETTDGAGNKVAYEYDAVDRILKRRVDPNGLNLVTSFEYDAKGQQVRVTDPNGIVTVREFDRKGRVLRETVDPGWLKLQTVYSYDARDNILSVTSAGGTLTQYGYDALGRRISERVDPAGLNLTRTWTYDGSGNAVTSTDACGNVTRHAYDAGNRLVFTIDPAGGVREFGYDAAGRVVKDTTYAVPITVAGTPAVEQIRPLLAASLLQDRVEHRVYDRDNRLAATVDGSGGVTKYVYDANGNVIVRTAYARRIDLATWTPGTVPLPVADPASDATLRTAYDSLNRAIYTVDGIGAVVAQSYDGNGNLLQRTAYARVIPAGTAMADVPAAAAAVADPLRDATVRNTYDRAGRLAWSADGTGAVTQRVYDAAGNVVKLVAYATPVASTAPPSSAMASAADRVTVSAYDAANRLMLQVDAQKAVTEFFYDGDGHVVQQLQYATPVGWVPEAGRPDTASTLRTLIWIDAANDRSTRFGYDGAGRRVLAMDAAGAVTQTDYDAGGNAIAVTGYAKAVDPAAVPQGATLAAMTALIVATPGADRVERSAYDSAGRRVYSVDPLGAVTASRYDALGQLTGTTRYARPIAATPSVAASIAAAVVADASADVVESFGYNAAGQRVSVTDAFGNTEWYGYDALGRKYGFLNKRGFQWTYTYDAAGRMLTETTPEIEVTRVTPDLLGNLEEIATPRARIVTRLGYDALGNLTERTEALGRGEERTTRYEYDAVGRQVRAIHPQVEVYDAATDRAVGKSLETQTVYDTLGNAIIGRDIGGATSQKVYDVMGRVAYEIDALGFVTGYTRNAYGDVLVLVRYAVAPSLPGNITRTTVEAALNAPGVDHSRDRTLTRGYDRAGRVTEIAEPAVYVYDAGAPAGKQDAITAKTTRYAYDSFGQRVQESTLRNSLTQEWLTTQHKFDRAGRETETVDAMGYLTQRAFDARGNLTAETQYANPNPTAASADDRSYSYGYDRLDRKVTAVETSKSLDGATLTATTTYGYDAVGNQVRVTDAEGGATYTYYDALGRISAVASPSRNSTVTGAAIIPLSSFRRDAYGNVLVKVDWAKGASQPWEGGYSVAAPDSVNDRLTLATYDKFGRSIQSQDATHLNGGSVVTMYDAYGHVAKQWRNVTDNEGVTRTAFEVNLYDKLGQLVETRTPAPATLGGDPGGFVASSVEYNAFGEVVRKGTKGTPEEFFEYDNAGRLWRTNSGTGVARIRLFDAVGNVTAEISSSGYGIDNGDVTQFANAQAAAANPYTRRVDTRYDALGHVSSKVEAVRPESQGGVSVLRQYTMATVNASAKDAYAVGLGANVVALTWNSLAALGSGDVKVSIEYRTPLLKIPQDREGEPVLAYAGQTTRTYTSGIFQGDAAAQGVQLVWQEELTEEYADVGIDAITRMVVWKKDTYGNWQVVIDQTPGYGASEITVAAPPDIRTAIALQMRVAGTTGDAGWWTAGLVPFGSGYRFDARGLGVGSYEYRVTASPVGDAPRVIATGNVAITAPPLSPITAPIGYGAMGAGVLAWAKPAAGYTQTFYYRASGSTGAWTPLTIAPRGNGSYDGVDTANLAGGTYQFELLWTPGGQSTPTAHAIGTFTVVPPAPPAWVPDQYLPVISGPWIETFGGTVAPLLVWGAANAHVAHYRALGGAWVDLPIDNVGQSLGPSGFTGTQRAPLGSIPAGTYEVEILAGVPPSARATATLTVFAQGPSTPTTVYVDVAVYTPVIDHYEPKYAIADGTRLVPTQVWVEDTPTSKFLDGEWIMIASGHWETQMLPETYTYLQLVGQTPVYARTDQGQIVYDVSYVNQAKQVWQAGTAPTPRLDVTYLPFVPAHLTPWGTAQFSASVTTAGASAALTAGTSGQISQAAGINGDQRWRRPTVWQKTDRWGNVTEISDPRTASWKTTYRYNAHNQLTQQVQPNAEGKPGAVTTITYDLLGRQVAVKDARGFVNRQVFDAGGNLVQEIHADTGVVRHSYNAFGERVATTDAMGNSASFSYDKLGRLLATTKADAAVYRANAWGAEWIVTKNIVDQWTYDQLGRKLTQTNGNGERIAYAYDLRGNLVQTKQPMGQAVRAAYDAQGRKIAEVDANGRSSTWAYDYFGLLKDHTDLGGVRFQYVYDNARNLVWQGSGRTQSISYYYDAAGQVTSIRDWTLDKTTTYAYDLSGRRIQERVVQAGVTYQDNHMAYDATGNLRDVADGRAHVTMDYDAVGNRTHITTNVDYQGVNSEVWNATDRYFVFDEMNRQKVVDALDAAGTTLGTQGHRIKYDYNGNRTSDTYWGNKVLTSGGGSPLAGYNEDGSAIYLNTSLIYTQTTGETTEEYRYDKLNRLQSVVKDGFQIDLRFYDAADRVVQSGPGGRLPSQVADLLNAGLAPGEMNGKETRVNSYDTNGRMLHQRIFKSDSNTAKADISWDTREPYTDGTTTLAADGYDPAGNVRSYVVKSHEGGGVTEYTSTPDFFEGYQGKTTRAVSTKNGNGTTTQEYDANGFLFRITDSRESLNDRSFVNDANGRALFVNQGGKVQRQFIVNGEVLGIYGAGVDQVAPTWGTTTIPKFADVADFDFGYARISASYPAPSPGAYTVRDGDSLQAIARGAYGDSSLWYRIAEANGLASSSDLKVGQTLNIPNRVSTISNNATTFKPYDPSRIEGDKSPALPMPAGPQGACGGMGQVLMLFIAIVVTIMSQGATAKWLGTALAAVGEGAAAGGAVAAGGGAAAGAGAAATAGAGAVSCTAAAASAASFTQTLITVASGAIGAAAGSLASQAFGVVIGQQQSISWKSVAGSAISGGVSAGLAPSMFSGFGVGAPVARAVVANALSQGISVAVGLQQRFDWRGVAASAVGTATGRAMESALEMDSPAFKDAELGNQLGKRLLAGLVAGGAAAAARGGRVTVQQVAVDAFGNALGESITEAMRDSATRVAGSEKNGVSSRPPSLIDLEELSLVAGPMQSRPSPTTRFTAAWSGILTATQTGAPEYATPIQQQQAAEVYQESLGTFKEVVEYTAQNPKLRDALISRYEAWANEGGWLKPPMVQNAGVALGTLLSNPTPESAVALSMAMSSSHGIRTSPEAMGGLLGMLALANDSDRITANLDSMARSSVEYDGKSYNSFQFGGVKSNAMDVASVIAFPVGAGATRAVTLAGRVALAAGTALVNGVNFLAQATLGTSSGRAAIMSVALRTAEVGGLPAPVPGVGIYSTLRRAAANGLTVEPVSPSPSNATRMGVIRRNDADMRQLRDLWDDLGYGEILSTTNRQFIAKGLRPKVDEAWIKVFPEDAGLVGERITPHHIAGLPVTIPLPKTRHMDAHMPGGFRYNPGGPGAAVPLYPAKPQGVTNP